MARFWPLAFDPRPLVFALVGVMPTSGLTQLSRQFAWWPLHALGFVVASSCAMYVVYLVVC